MASQYSNFEMDAYRESHTPQALPDRDSNAPEVYSAPNAISYRKSGSDPSAINREQPRRVCGLTTRELWLVGIIIFLIVVGAVVGGAVGGTQAAQSSQSGDGDNDSTASSTATTEKTDEPTLTTSGLAGSSVTLYRDCPSSDDTVYKAKNAHDVLFRKFCSSYTGGSTFGDIIVDFTSSLDDCIESCSGHNRVYQDKILGSEVLPCTSVCWRHSPNDSDPGKCFGELIRNTSSDKIPVRPDNRCDAAMWINVPYDLDEVFDKATNTMGI